MGAARMCLAHGRERPALAHGLDLLCRPVQTPPSGGVKMVEGPLHVVFGTGQVGLDLAAELPASGIDWRAGGPCRRRGHRRRDPRRISRLPVPQRLIHAVPGTLPAVAAQRAESSRTHRCPPGGQMTESVGMRPTRGTAVVGLDGRPGGAAGSPRRTAFIAGLFFIGTFVFSIPAALLYGPVLKAGYVVGSGGDHRVVLGAFLEILLAICNIGTAVVLFPIVKRQSEKVSLAYIASRVFESTVIVMGAISLLSVVTLRHDFAGATGADAATFVTVGKSLVAFHGWTALIGPVFCAGLGNGVLLGYLMYRSGLVPRPWAVLGLVGGSLCLASATARLFTTTNGQTTKLTAVLVVPEFAWEAFLAMYLTFKGFKQSPVLDSDRPVAVGDGGLVTSAATGRVL